MLLHVLPIWRFIDLKRRISAAHTLALSWEEIAVNAGQTIFARLMEFVFPYQFRQRYQFHYRSTCWDQFLWRAFAQFMYQGSLRNIQACLRVPIPFRQHKGTMILHVLPDLLGSLPPEVALVLRF